ncbi:MAG: hypothetical protein N2258_01720, partial [Brevinematales bacterium]|nr:hypothetical protein [Brevinematales bacterium]
MRGLILVFLILSLVKSYNIYAREMLLDGSNRDYLISSVIPSSDVNPLKYMIFNLFDNNLATTVAVNSKYNPYKEVKFPYFRIWFKKLYKVDKIVIYNGFQKNDELYFKNCRGKEISITVLNYTDKEKVDEYSISIETNILLNDTKEPQAINLPDVSGEHWIIDFQSTYPGSVYDDICISEIEFWYKGKKYEVANLEKAKKEYIELRRREIIWQCSGVDVAHSLGIKDNIDNVTNRLKEVGIEVDKLNIDGYSMKDNEGNEHMVTELTIEFSYSSETNGGIWANRR